LRGGVITGTSPSCWGKDSFTHTLLNCKETKRLRAKYLGKKWLQMNEVTAFKKLARCSKTTDLRQLDIFLYKVRCKWDHHREQSGEKV